MFNPWSSLHVNIIAHVSDNRGKEILLKTEAIQNTITSGYPQRTENIPKSFRINRLRLSVLPTESEKDRTFKSLRAKFKNT